MGKHDDSAEKAALDLTVNTLLRFVKAANLHDDMAASLTPDQMNELNASSRRHERREKHR